MHLTGTSSGQFRYLIVLFMPDANSHKVRYRCSLIEKPAWMKARKKTKHLGSNVFITVIVLRVILTRFETYNFGGPWEIFHSKDKKDSVTACGESEACSWLVQTAVKIDLS